jgi:hypothetical protein
MAEEPRPALRRRIEAPSRENVKRGSGNIAAAGEAIAIEPSGSANDADPRRAHDDRDEPEHDQTQPLEHRDLVSYAEVLGSETGQTIEPGKLIPHMLARFMTSDRGFKRAHRAPSWVGGHSPA